MTNDPSLTNDNQQDLLERLRLLEQHKQESIEFQQKFETLQAISMQLDKTPSFDELCRLGVEAGLEHLEVDRMGFWFVDEKREFLTGTFGVDETGQIRDERHQRKRFENETLRALSFGEIDMYRNQNAPLYNDKGEVIGYGWVVVVPLVNGDDIVGYLACDNLINQRPLKSYQHKLLQLYGATIGFLAQSKKEQSRRQMFQYAIEQSKASIFFINLMCEVTYRNSSMLSLFDNKEFRHAQEIIDFINMRDVNTSSKVIDWQELSEGTQRYSEWQLNTTDGSDVFIEMRVSTISEHGQIVQYLMRFDDVTMRREAEQQKLQLQIEHERAELLQTFVTHTAHEFKTPLSIINTKAYLVSRHTSNEKVKEYTTSIQEQSKNVQYLLDDMLEMVRLQNQTELNNIHTNLSSTISTSAINAQQSELGQARQWTVDIQSDLFAVIDEMWFSKAINNILENAIVYSDKGSEIVVEAFENDDNLHINIRDHGIGIPKDKLPYIFEPLYRVDEARTMRGTGLGLAITQRVIEGCNGKIYATSTVDVGTTIHISLPKSTA